VGSNPSFTKKNLYGNDGPLDGRKTNKNNKDSQIGQVTPKKKIFKKDLKPHTFTLLLFQNVINL